MSAKQIKLLKIVYFDEGSAIDYLDVYNGGLKIEEQTQATEQNGQAELNTNIKAKTGILFKALKPFLGIEISGSAGASFSGLNESALKITISNTVLSDFIKLAEKDKNIVKTENNNVYAQQESITFLKMYTPYLNMINMQSEGINFSKIDETLEKSKGYYELVARNVENTNTVFRFNINAFRNNYNLVDLTKMSLRFYSIKVGTMNINNLNAKKELDFGSQEKILTTSDILASSDGIKESIVDIYDVLLAGIQTNE